ncbi:MAG: MXAN_6640 family putative metalloprotease [Bacteroidota bacterium]
MEDFFESVSVRFFDKAFRVTVVCLVLAGMSYAQSLDSRLRGAQSLQRVLESELHMEGADRGVKCGTSLVALVHSRWRELPPHARLAIAQALQRPEKDKSKPSPSGRFRIHYDTTGVDAPALIPGSGLAVRLPNTYEQYVDSVAAIFDYCLQYETDSLGYGAPPPDGQQGGGPEYDIYIGELGSGMFGETIWDPSIDLIEDGPRQRYSSHIKIDNDYLGHRTSGMSGLRVTAAHELFHAIQIGSYGIWNSSPNFDFYFYELSSVWMEDVLFTWINDYYFDIRTYFRSFRDGQNRSYSFATFVGPLFYGYERSVWAHFLTKRFTRSVIREIWDGMRVDPFFQSSSKVIQRHGSTIEAEFALFSSWNFFTADRADTVRFYDEGRYYPRFLPNATTSFNGLAATIATSGFPLSTQLYQFIVPGDTVTAIVANVEVNQAIESATVARTFEVRLTSGQTRPPYQNLSKGFVAGFSADQTNAWRTMYLESSTRANANAAPDPSPNPLRLSKDTRLTLPLTGTRGSSARIYVLSSSLDLVFSGEYAVVESFGNRMAYVPAADMRSSVSSGIYFVVARCDKTEFTWKIAIVQ